MRNLDAKEAKRMASVIVKWYGENKRDLPWRREPYCSDAYCVYISEIMLQQTQVKTVIPYWERWMRELPTIEALAAAKEDCVLKLWEGLGYYSRARNLQKAARMIVAGGNGFPRDLNKILELPGIGPYTAGAIASIAFGLPAPILDGNVMRVLTRVFALRGNPKEQPLNAQLWEMAATLAKTAEPLGACSHLNQGLMELGALLCSPRGPNCEVCPLAASCKARETGSVEALPELPARAPATERVFSAALIQRDKKILFVRRPAGVVNAGFWELPNVEGKSKRKCLVTVRHTITRYRMTLKVYGGEGAVTGGKYFALRELQKIPIVNAHRKALIALGLMADSKP